MGYCVAVGCQSRSSRKHESVNSDVNISFYRLPSNPTLKKIWIQKIKREDFPTDESKQKNRKTYEYAIFILIKVVSNEI